VASLADGTPGHILRHFARLLIGQTAGRVGKTDTRGKMGIKRRLQRTYMKIKTALLNEYEERAVCRQNNSD